MINKLIQKNKKLIFLEAHNPLCAIIINNSFYTNPTNKKIYRFDGIWSSSLADSTCKGLPDNEILDIRERIKNLIDIRSVTNLPIIMDADSGKNSEYFSHYIKIIQQADINSIVIEDKKGIKRNSLLKINKKQKLEDIEKFCEKIKIGKKNVYKKNFSIIARMEGLILGKSIDETINRAFKSTKAGADIILIHSKKKTHKEIANFSKLYKKKYPYIPLACIPTTYNYIKNNELYDLGFNIIIYSNHMIRSSYKIMTKITKKILKFKRTYEIEKNCTNINKILKVTNKFK